MELSRRRFFGLLGGVVAAKVAAPIFVLAPPAGWGMSAFGLVSPDSPAKFFYREEIERSIQALESAVTYDSFVNAYRQSPVFYFNKVAQFHRMQSHRIPMNESRRVWHSNS